MAAARKAEIASLFSIFDRDGDGSLTIDEIKAVYTRGPGGLNEAELEQTVKMFMEYDKDGDGVIDIDEFTEAFGDLALDEQYASIFASSQLPSAADLGVDEKKLEIWRKKGGGDLEPFLASGAVALLDTQWVVLYAETGGVLTHRQALPKEAFLSLADLVEATVERVSSLPVAALSYPWLTKAHPDPDGANLRRVAKALKALLNPGIGGESGVTCLARLGVFWDFGSLYQHPDPANRVLRTEAENALFTQGLGCLGTLYSHECTTVLRLTSFPEGHKMEDQGEGTNTAAYFQRGWCFTESSWAGLTKGFQLSLDLGLMRDDEEYNFHSFVGQCTKGGQLRAKAIGRRPPLLPSHFAEELETKTFTNGKDDKPLVKKLYEAAFKEQFGKATLLGYDHLGWGDPELVQVAEVIASGAAPRVERLFLSANQIGNEGCKALAAALGKEGAAPRLEELYIYSEDRATVDLEGYKALADALKEGAAPSLKVRDALPSPYVPPLPAHAYRTSPRVQKLQAGNYLDCGSENPYTGEPSSHPVLELTAVCKERGILLDVPESNGY